MKSIFRKKGLEIWIGPGKHGPNDQRVAIRAVTTRPIPPTHDFIFALAEQVYKAEERYKTEGRGEGGEFFLRELRKACEQGWETTQTTKGAEDGPRNELSMVGNDGSVGD